MLRLIRAHFDETVNRTSTALSLYLALTEAASNQAKDQFSTTISELMSLSGHSRSTVIRLLKEFEGIGILKVERRREGDLNLPSIYTLLDSGVPSLPLVSEELLDNKHLRRTEKKEEKKKEKENRNKYSEEFEDFWKAYPRKKSKGSAWKAFQSIDPDDELLDKMITSIEAWKKSKDWTRDDGQFIPYPATWLNAEGWLDELPEIEKEEFGDTTYVPGRSPE